MIKKAFFLFITVFILVINFSVSSVKADFFERVLFFSLFVSLFFLFRYIDLRRIFLLLTAAVSAIVFSYGIIQKFILFPIYLGHMDSGISEVSKAMKERIASGRIFSIFSLPTLYTFVCAVLLLAIFHYLLNSEKISGKIFWSALLLAGIFNIVLTQSFSGILYLIAGFPAYMLLSGRATFKLLVPLLMVLSLFLFLISGLRFREARKLEPVKLRLANWSQSLRMINVSPFLGVGMGNYESRIPGFTFPDEPRSIYAHNFILQFTAETGLIGLFLGISLLIIFRKKLRPGPDNGNALYISILLIIILYNLIDIGFYFFSASLIFTMIISQVYRKKGPVLPGAVTIITIALIIPQVLIFASSGYRKTGSFHLNFNRFEKAEPYFKKSLGINKFNHKALMGLAKTSFAANDPDGSERFLDRADNINHLIPYSHYLRSRILFGRQKYLSSFYHAGKAVNLNRNNGEYVRWFEFIKQNLTSNLYRAVDGE